MNSNARNGSSTSFNADKSLKQLALYFEKADAIHREAWWVLSNSRPSIGRSPFGKIHRALLSSMNIKLSKKTFFKCDRYFLKHEILKKDGYPQRAEIFEKCSDKERARKIGQFVAVNALEVQVIFYPENLEDILGLGPTVLNKEIQCDLKGNEQEQLVSLSCKDWAQERNKEEMLRLDLYEYQLQGQNIIKLRGKVFENLSEMRKVEVDIPMTGKILVTETELYPPESPAKPQVPIEAKKTPISPLPVTAPKLDPDVLVQQQQQGQQQQELPLPLPPTLPSDADVVSPPAPQITPLPAAAGSQGSFGSFGEGNVPLDETPRVLENPAEQNSNPPSPIPAGGVYGR